MTHEKSITEDEQKLLNKLKKKETLEYRDGLKLKVNQMDSLSPDKKSKLPENQFFGVNTNVLPMADSGSSDDLMEEVKEDSGDNLVINGFKKLRESRTQDYPIDINQQIDNGNNAAAKSPHDTSPIYNDQRPSTGNHLPSSNHQNNF